MNLSDALSRLTTARAFILGIVLAAIYYIGFFDNGANIKAAIQQSRQTIQTQTQQSSVLDRELDQMRKMKQSYSELGNTLKKLLSYIPENFRSADFQKLVSEEAKIAGVNIDRITNQQSGYSPQGGDQKIPPEFEELGVDVQLSGSYSQILTFLSNLTKHKQLFILNKFTMSVVPNNSPNSQSDQVLVSFDADIKAYRYKGDKKGQ